MQTHRKAKIQNDFNGLLIQIPAAKNILVLIFFIIWLCGWFYFAVDVFETLQKPEEHRNYFLMIWLAGWTLGGIQVFRSILWALFGKETINISNYEIKLKDSTLGFGKTHRFSIHELKSVEFNQPSVSEESDYPGKILLHRNSKVYSYGTNLDEIEAKSIIDLIKSKIPHLKHSSITTNET